MTGWFPRIAEKRIPQVDACECEGKVPELHKLVADPCAVVLRILTKGESLPATDLSLPVTQESGAHNVAALLRA